jgi:hypothetical protein
LGGVAAGGGTGGGGLLGRTTAEWLDPIQYGQLGSNATLHRAEGVPAISLADVDSDLAGKSKPSRKPTRI